MNHPRPIIIAAAAVLLASCQAPVGLVRDRGPDTLVAAFRELRTPPDRSTVENLRARLPSLPADLRAGRVTTDLDLDPADIVALHIASDYRAEHLLRHYRRDGTGTPLVVHARPTAPHHPSDGRFLPATAVQRPGGSLHLADPLADPSLAADFSIPFSFHAEAHDDDSARIKGLVFADKVQPGFHIHDPYDPDKIPLVMVHGLGGSSASWNYLSNLVLGTPALRNRYQVWHYNYPTGVPVLDAAAEFRDRFHTFRKALARDTGRGEPRHPAVFVAHSLGGLMVKTLASDSGTALRDAAGDTPDHPAFHFETSPHIARAVCVASPLNGSSLAAMPGAEIASFIPSIPTLARDHPVTAAFATIPTDPAVPFHLVLGRKYALSDTRYTDGVVSSRNAALPGAASVKTVRTDTHNVHYKPAALREIRRILYLHLEG